MLISLWVLVLPSFGTETDSTQFEIQQSDAHPKSGWSFGGIPALAYDSDLGFLYGAILEVWDYGNGTKYPRYDHSFYMEYSRTTKGSGIAQIVYDSPSLIKGLRTIGELSFLTEQALDFYGFNGYRSGYESRLEDDSPDNPDYLSRLYYRQSREMLRIRSDFQGRFFNPRLQWVTGFTYYSIHLDTIDTPRLNKGRPDNEQLPYIDGGLYGKYAYTWKLIPEDQIHGGSTALLKAGLIYDTRDNEANPMKGFWTEAVLHWAPPLPDAGISGFGKLSVVHRHYFSLVPNRFSLVYRLAWQSKLWGTIPHYLLPVVLNGGTAKDRDGVGGAKTARGILRNRIVGDHVLYGNLELRWKILRTTLFKKDFYLALSAFSDFGRTFGEYPLDTHQVPAEFQHLFPNTGEHLHLSYGAGIHLAMNENFVVAVDQGYAMDPRDGDQGLYIGMNWLF